MTGRTLAIGDVHGCHRALITLLDQIALQKSDTLIFLGDLVDRGPSSREVIDEILNLQTQDTCKVIAILGNHDEVMRDAIAGQGMLGLWLGIGGQETVESYDGDLANVPPEHIRFLLSLRDYYETETEIFVHANLESDVSMINQTSDFLRWEHLGGMEQPHVSGKRVICGHTAQIDGIPLTYPGWVCIDTYAFGGGWLSCLDVAADHIYQASQAGKTRDFPLSQYP